MRERSLDQFESIFEQASVPVFDIPDVEIRRISVLIQGDDIDESVLRVARHLRERFGAEGRLFWHGGVPEERAKEAAQREQLDDHEGACNTAEELIGKVQSSHSQLAVVNASDEMPTPEVELDRFVEGVTAPVLIIREKIAEPANIFDSILHSLPGNFQQKQNFAYSFALVAPTGSVLLLHTIDQDEIEDVRDVLRVTDDIDLSQKEEVLRKLASHGERYLKGVVAAATSLECNVSYRLEVGDAVSIVENELQSGDYGLLVVGSHEEGRSHIGAEVYRLMHLVRNRPVLAL